MQGQRARLTIPDLVFLLASVAILGALYPVFSKSFQANIDVIPTSAAWLFMMVLPMSILVMMTMVYVRATEGLQ